MFLRFDSWVNSQILVKFAVQASLKDYLVDPFYQMKYFIIPLFFTFKMENNMWLAYYQEHFKASDDSYE